MVCILSETPLEKTNLFFVSSYQLEIAPGLGTGTCVYFISQLWDPFGLDCSRTVHADTDPEFMCVLVLLCLEGLSPWCPPSSLALTILLPPLSQLP